MNINFAGLLVPELQQEAATTRRLLERLPPDRLAWRPHDKSMPLGRLAAHIAHLPEMFIARLSQDALDMHTSAAPPADDVAGILGGFDRDVAAALDTLRALPADRFAEPWRYMYGEHLIFELPRAAVARAIGINHLIHHRGQLSVYLRLLDVPVPPIYGPSADEEMPR